MISPKSCAESQPPADVLLTMPSTIELLDTELTPDGIGMKIVFSGTREDGKEATFETGSFFDQYGTEENPDRHDICVSTAGGCTRQCRFCSVPDADLGFERLLTPEEIVFQVQYAIAARNPNATMPNVVGLMGNGEPPDNIAIIPAVQHLATEVDNISRITVSTIGENVRNIGKMASAFADLDMQTILQFSLHTADEEQRRRIIPGRLPLETVLRAIDGYAETTGEPVKFNVVLMEGSGDEFRGFSNARVEDAKRLAGLLLAPSYASGDRLERLLKLSAFNTIPGKEFNGPHPETIQSFVDTLEQEGVTKIQWFKGSGTEIDPDGKTGGFACGQLRATTSKSGSSTPVKLTAKPGASSNETQESARDAEWKTKRILFVLGIHAVGKSSITKEALDNGYAVFDAGPILKKYFNLDETEVFEDWIAKSEATYGEDFVARLLAAHIQGELDHPGTGSHPEGIVIIGPRKVRVVEYLQHALKPSDSKSILIEAPNHVLFDRYKDREGTPDITAEEFDQKLTYDRSLGVDALRQIADAIIQNDTDIAAPAADLRHFLDSWNRTR